MKINKKMVVIIILVLLFIRPTYRLLQRIQINYYFMTNYNSDEYKIVRKLYYESRRLSDITDELEVYGITFPSYVYEIQVKSSFEKIPGLEVTKDHFYLGTNGFTIWDTYKIVVDGIVNTKDQLEYRFHLLVRDIISEVDGENVSARITIAINDEEVNELDTSEKSFVESTNIMEAHKHLNLYVSDEEMDREKVAEVVKKSNRLLEQSSIYIDEFLVFVYIEGEDVGHYRFKYEDVKNGNLVFLIEQQDSKNRK